MAPLSIRPELMSAFDAEARESFEARAVRHLRTYFPSQTSAQGDRELRQTVRSSGLLARNYGFHTERQIMRFVDTTYLLGERFDLDPNYTWGRHILDARQVEPDRRSAVLLNRAQVVAAGHPYDALVTP